MMQCCLSCDVMVRASSELMVSSHGFMIDDDDDDADDDGVQGIIFMSFETIEEFVAKLF